MVFTVSIVSGESENETIVVKLPMNEKDLAKEVAPRSPDSIDWRLIKDIKTNVRGLDIDGVIRFNLVWLNMIAVRIDEFRAVELDFLEKHKDIFNKVGYAALHIIKSGSDFTDDELKVFDTLVANGYSYDAALVLVKNKEYKIHKNVPTYVDVAEECVRSLGGIENLSISTLMEYFDWDRYGRDLCVINSLYEIENSADRVEVLDGTAGRL